MEVMIKLRITLSRLRLFLKKTPEELRKVGSRAKFQVLHRDSSVVGAKAVNVKVVDIDISENLL